MLKVLLPPTCIPVFRGVEYSKTLLLHTQMLVPLVPKGINTSGCQYLIILTLTFKDEASVNHVTCGHKQV